MVLHHVSVFRTGAEQPSSRNDLYVRASLLFDELGMGETSLTQFKYNLESQISEPVLSDWATEATKSPMTIPLIKRFSRVEGDISNAGLKGQGRVSTAFPRLGGVLHSTARKQGVPVESVVSAVELTVHAGYLASLLLYDSIAEKPLRDDTELVWRQWIFEAYTVPEQGVEAIWGIAGFVEFWRRFLERSDLSKDAKKLAKYKRTPFVNSLSGLVGVGMALAATERIDPRTGT